MERIRLRKVEEDKFKESGIKFEYRIIKKDGTFKPSSIKSRKAILVSIFDI